MRFSDLKYTQQELENDAINYLETQIYQPSYSHLVKKFIKDDLVDFKRYYDDAEYGFYSIYYDEYIKGYVEDGNEVMAQFNNKRLLQELNEDFGSLGIEIGQLEKYIEYLELMFRKNAYCSHMEPYFIGTEGVVTVVISGYSQNPIYSIYDMVRQWCLALHLKKMYPTLTRRFGYQYQEIREKYVGEERKENLAKLAAKNKITSDNIKRNNTFA